LNIDVINEKLGENNKNLVEYGIFYKDNDLIFEAMQENNNNNKALDKLFENCLNLKRIFLLNKALNYENLLKDKILSIEFNKNNFQLCVCYGLDEVRNENFRINNEIINQMPIPKIKPPINDFHSKFL
jgi:hypothetical protein